MIVYRVEDEFNGEGPFSSFGTFGLKYNCIFANSHIFPGARSDGLQEEMERGYIVGCSSLDLIYYWFHTEDMIHILKRDGYVIRQYDTETYRIGKSGKQVAFDGNSPYTKLVAEDIPWREYEYT